MHALLVHRIRLAAVDEALNDVTCQRAIYKILLSYSYFSFEAI